MDDGERALAGDEYQENRFNERREWRQQQIEFEGRVASIATQQINKAVYSGGTIILVLIAWSTYGWLGLVGGLILVGILLAWLSRQEKNDPLYKRDQIDEAAEETVLHRRIKQADDAGLEWLDLSSKEGWDWEPALRAPPFWKLVNDQVKTFERQSHEERQRELKAVRAASLPARLKMKARLKEAYDKTEMPWFATIWSEERA